METDAIIERILANTFTKADATHRLILLEDLVEDQGDGASFEARVARVIAPEDERAADAIARWGEDLAASLAGAEGGERMRDVKDAIEKLPIMVIYAPVAIAGEDAEAIARWCRENVHPRVLLEFKADANAAGGCIVAWEGKLLDLSFSRFAKAHEPDIAALVERLAPPA